MGIRAGVLQALELDKGRSAQSALPEAPQPNETSSDYGGAREKLPLMPPPTGLLNNVIPRWKLRSLVPGCHPYRGPCQPDPYRVPDLRLPMHNIPPPSSWPPVEKVLHPAWKQWTPEGIFAEKMHPNMERLMVEVLDAFNVFPDERSEGTFLSMLGYGCTGSWDDGITECWDFLRVCARSTSCHHSHIQNPVKKAKAKPNKVQRKKYKGLPQWLIKERAHALAVRILLDYHLVPLDVVPPHVPADCDYDSAEDSVDSDYYVEPEPTQEGLLANALGTPSKNDDVAMTLALAKLLDTPPKHDDHATTDAVTPSNTCTVKDLTENAFVDEGVKAFEVIRPDSQVDENNKAIGNVEKARAQELLRSVTINLDQNKNSGTAIDKDTSTNPKSASTSQGIFSMQPTFAVPLQFTATAVVKNTFLELASNSPRRARTRSADATLI